MSNMLSGERRLASASARRGGMTVIGKIAVPKPINLPSQRSENHGLDPSVEIVPKGTLSWGSRSSSSTSNAWGSSTQSPRNDGGNGSPRHLSGRPSSGGSGTRPSTAGSDRAHEPTASAWGPNSRPSSASGSLTSNQTSLRPRSAETRPGSSQLSRFAESLSENPGAWGAAGTAERLGVTALKNDEFSLTSGDFPTLGSEKDNSGKNTEAQDHGSHGRPGSSSGGVASVKERSDVFVNDNVKSGAVNSWRGDNPPYGEDGARPNVEKWQVDPQPYPNPSIPPQHFEAWHGPPPGAAVWYRGPPGGPPYGAPVAHGGFPMEPFPYYRPQIPATALANPQPVPSQGGGPRGHRPKNADFYRPQMPDAYIRPGMPISPGFYPGPVPYDGYYGRPMGYCNSNERDVPFMGMAAGPSVYNRYPSQNAPEPANSHGRSSGYGSTGKALVSEQPESGYPHDARGPYKVLLKQPNGRDGKDEEQKWEGAVTTSATYVEKGDRPSSWENDWRSDYRNDEDMGSRRKAPGEEVSSQTSDNRGAFSSVPVKGKSPESVGNMRAFDDISARNMEHAASGLPEIPQPVSAVPKDSSLIQKIEGLNAKARASDGRHDITSVSSWEGQKNKFHVVNAKANHSANDSGTDSVHTERTHASGISNRASHEIGVSAGDKSLESVAVSGTAISRRPTHGMQGRADNRGKGGFNTQEDGWRKKFPVADSPNVVSAARSETNSNLHVHDCHTSVEASEQSGSYPQARDVGESAPPVFDPSDYQAQRPKMKELAKQRAKQRMEEEEERLKKQKAKADAKLEELNRRTLAMEGSTQKSENASSGAGNTSRVEKSPILSSELPLEKPKSANKEPVVAHIQSVPLQQDADRAHVSHRDNASQVHDVSVLKQKRTGYKQNQNFSLEKNSNEKVICTSTNEAPKGHTDAAGIVTVSVGGVADGISSIRESSLPVNANPVAESSIHQKKKNSRSGKNKHKVEDTSSMAALPSSESKETNLVNASVERVKPKASEPDLDPNSVQSVAVSKDANQFSEQCSSFSNEDSHGRMNGQWKSQHSRKTSRNPQVNRLAEKIHNNDAVWAPVRPQNKTDVTEEASHKNVVEAVTPSVKSGQVQGNPKNKRAEMERYVPKPVAKEMAQQESVQQPVASSVNQTTSDDTVGRADSSSQGTESTQTAGSAIGKVGFALESRNGDGRQNKQGKAQGSWRQRSSAESISVQSMQDGPSSYPSRNVQKSIEHHQPQKPDVSSVKEQPKVSDEWNDSDGWNMPDNSDSGSPVTVTAVKEQGTGRAKRYPFKGHRGVGNNSDQEQKKISGDNNKINTHSLAPEVSQADSSFSSKENRGSGERSTAHWQPKSQTFSANNQRGSRPSGGQNVDADVVRTNRKESTPQGPVPLAPGHDKKTSEGVSQPHPSQSASGKSNAEEAVNVGHQEAKRERKVGSVKGRPQSPNQVPVSPAEQVPPSSVDVRHEQRSSTGFRKSGSQNNRFGRGHESRGDWSSSGQDNKQHNPAANWERQRHNSHYEYQPVEPYNNNKSNSAEGPRDGTHNTGSSYRERGQNHSRRGGGSGYGR